MTLLQAIVLGVIQGITEFLPISSSGHLLIFPNVFGWTQQGLDFDVMIHVATLGAILWVLQEDIGNMLMHIWKKADEAGSLGRKLLVATIPVGVAGVIISSQLLADVRTVPVVAVQLIIWGALLWIADLYASKGKSAGKVKNVKKTSWVQAVIIGFAQVIALVPGASRSGVTITAGLFSGLDRRTAAKFSFLLAVPAIAGAGLLTAIDAFQHGISTPFPVMVVGFLAAFFSGILSMQLLLKFVERIHYGWFAGYRIVLGVALLLFAFL